MKDVWIAVRAALRGVLEQVTLADVVAGELPDARARPGGRRGRLAAALMVLGTRALNRALLARQGLLDRRPVPPRTMVEHLVGLQAQVPQHPYFALWSRIEGFDPEALAALVERREALRIARHALDDPPRDGATTRCGCAR